MDQGTVELPKSGYASRFQFGCPAKKGSTQRKSRFHSGQHSLAFKIIQLICSRSCQILSFASCSVFKLQQCIQNNIIAWNQYNMYSQSHSFFPKLPSRPTHPWEVPLLLVAALCVRLYDAENGDEVVKGLSSPGEAGHQWKMPPNWDLATSLLGTSRWFLLDDDGWCVRVGVFGGDGKGDCNRLI